MTHRSDRAAEIREDIFADRDLSRDLKLFVLAGVHLWETKPERHELKTFRREHWAYRALRMCGREGTIEELTGPLRHMIREDVPKYRVDFSRPATCLGTMLRPAGAPCKRRTSMQTTIPNPLTGERSHVGSCNDRRHQQQANAHIKAAWQAWRDNGEPKPKPNSGGLLLRYFTSGIEPLYAWADKDYTPGDKVAEPPEQRLAVVVSITDRRRDESDA
jgi:hypothetical protein